MTDRQQYWRHAVKFARWQHRAVERAASFGKGKGSGFI